MAGLYIHIPFCNAKCAYCGFYSLPSLKLKDRFIEALKEEIIDRKAYLKGEPIHTIYFGGGTPSLLTTDEIDDLLYLIIKHYPVDTDAEVTLEANPDTLSESYLYALLGIGINRLSIGIQSFFDNDLKYLSRRHDSAHARQCINWAKRAGFDNISIDLIYGLPTSNADQWNKNLDYFFDLQIPHLSAYALTLEPNAILTKQIEQGKVPPVNEDDALRDYETLCRRAKENGYLHYEISNFCLAGRHSKHNSSYWFGTPYAGFGPSAHSYDGKSRQWNVASVEKYMDARLREAGRETLSPEQRYDEYVMLRLRTCWGVDLKWMRREMGNRFANYCERQAQPLIAQGRLSQTREFLYLDDQQMLFADGVAEELFWEE